MKRIVIILISLITLIAIPASVLLTMRSQELRKKAAPATTLTLTPTTLNKAVGEEFTLEVRMDTAGNQIVAVDLKLSFDPAKLEAEWIHNGTMFPNILSSGTVGNGTISMALGATNTTTPISGTGTVATIKFKALAATTSPVAVRFTADTFVGALNEGSTNALTSTIPATITIGGAGGGTGTGTVTPTLASSITPTLTPTLAASDSASPSGITIDSPTKNESVATQKPTIVGTAPPGTTVTITVYSDPITVTVTADANGNWTYTLADELEAGPHTIVVAAQDPTTGQSHTATLAFVVATGSENGASGSAIPVSGTTENTILLLTLGMLFILIGSAVPLLRRTSI
ncbi:hypothetical protein HZB58_01840 [Candidatus Gottesmanbacteria bacterium]|nr:hypothetical protein [Candidatus Gottesmanbacteria bacterium]